MPQDLLKNLPAHINKKFFEKVAEESPHMVFINLNGRIVYANKMCEKTMGYSKKEFYAPSFSFVNLIAPEARHVVEAAYQKHLKNKEVPPYEYSLLTKSKKKLEVIITTKLIKIDGRPGILGIVTDITRLKQAELALRGSEEKYRTIINSLSDLIYVVDRNLRVELVNEALKQFMRDSGFKKDVTRMNIFAAFPFLNKKVKAEFVKVLKDGGTLVTEENTKIKGRMVYTETRKIPIFSGNEVVSVVTVMKDITKRKSDERKLSGLNEGLKKSNKKLESLALLDSQTGLYNHRFLCDTLEAEFSRAKRQLHPLSVLMLDIDYFKSINDVYGHQFGDLVLKQFSVRLKKLVRKYDTVSRYGGEEFVVILPGTGGEPAKMLAHRILDTMNLENFGSGKNIIKLRVSIAVSSYPEDRIVRSLDLLEVADQALNKAKEYGGNRVFSTEDIKSEKPAEHFIEEDKARTGITYLKEKMDRLHKRANQSLIEAVFAFAKTIELKDHYTGEHVERTVYYAAELGRELGVSKEEMGVIKQAAILHDLGKVGISEKILLKKTKLTKNEFDEIMEHPAIGADIIRPIHLLHDIIPLIMYHHERWDGKGYPVGLKGEEIPIGARIISIADSYQALISNRPYRRAYSKKKALAIIVKNSGTHFDPRVVEAFIRVISGKGRRQPPAVKTQGN